MPPDRQTLLRALNLAARAPSPHNTQPWQVIQRGAELQILADPERLLPHGDPARRDAGLALGAFAEALRIGLAAEGHAAELVEAKHGEELRLDTSRGPLLDGAKPLASLVRQRQSSRLPYSPREPEGAALEELKLASLACGLELHLMPRGSAEHAKLSDWLFAGIRENWLDVQASKELARWTRLDFDGLRAPEDGLSTSALNLGVAEALALRALLQPGPWRLLEAVYLAPALAELLAKSERAQADAAPFFAVWIATGPAVEAGGAMLRAWLETTRLGFAMHPLSVLLDRRGWELARLLGVDARRLVMAFRLGKSAPPPRSGRRPAERFASLSA